MGIEIHASADEALFLRAHDAYAGVGVSAPLDDGSRLRSNRTDGLAAHDAYAGAPASSYTPGGCGTAREAPTAALSGAASNTEDGPPPSYAREDPPGLLLLELTAPAAIVVVATSTRIAISPDYAEEFGRQLIAAAGAARAAKVSMQMGVDHGHVRTD